MQCPNCQATVNLRHINQGNIQGLQVQFTCPSCTQVLSVNTKATFSKLIGALVALVSGGVMIWGPASIFYGAAGGCVAGVAMALVARHQERALPMPAPETASVNGAKLETESARAGKLTPRSTYTKKSAPRARVKRQRPRK